MGGRGRLGIGSSDLSLVLTGVLTIINKPGESEPRSLLRIDSTVQGACIQDVRADCECEVFEASNVDTQASIGSISSSPSLDKSDLSTDWGEMIELFDAQMHLLDTEPC